MKKFGLVLVLFVFAISFSYSDTEGSLLVSGTVAQQLTVSLGADVTELVLNAAAGATVPLGNVTARSNIRPWTIQFKAMHGALTLYEDSAPVLAEQIAYTFNFNKMTSETTEKITGETLTTDYADTSLEFERKTSGGSGGEVFPIDIEYVAEASQPTNKNWVAGTYQDTIYVQVIAP